MHHRAAVTGLAKHQDGGGFVGGQVRKDLLQGLAKGMLVTLMLLLAIKLGDLIVAGELGLIFNGSFQGNMFILENLTGIILPIAILLVPKFRNNLDWIFRAGLLTLLGLIMYRLNIGLVSMAGAPYFPHLLELAVTVGLFSGGILAFGLAMKNLPLEAE